MGNGEQRKKKRREMRIRRGPRHTEKPTKLCMKYKYMYLYVECLMI